MTTRITHFETHDIRFPTSLTGDGTDAMNTDCDYSSAYVTIYTDSGLIGHGMTFTIGRGTDIVCHAIRQLAGRLVGRDPESFFENMGKAWDWMCSDSQLRWIGPEKGVIHLATAAVNNALWDMFARARGKPLWKLIVDMTPEELVNATAFRYITDVLTREEALAMLTAKEAGKREREALVTEVGYPAYITSAGWLGYSDEKVSHLTKEAIASGFNHFKMKVGADFKDDLRRGKMIRSIIDDPANYPSGFKDPSSPELAGKNAGPTGAVLMIDANQVWDVPQAIEYVTGLAEIKPWFIEEPTAPDDALGHAAIRRALKSYGIGVATGEHAHNRIMFKQLFQAEAIDVCQIDSCRLAGVSEVLSVLLMAAKFGVPVCPHAGGVGLCEYVIHLSVIDYIAISGTMERNVLEFADHLHEHFPYRCTMNKRGRYNVPSNPKEGYSIEMYKESIAKFEWPNGSYWVGARGGKVLSLST
ncbi:enolase C-terminal domain-like protein [Suillus subluteus]|nr:enolase C-terminal domain-like protein [Suillus subluteus]